MSAFSNQPFIAGAGLTLGAVARAAGVVRNGLMGAGIALLEVASESGGAACADVAERPPLLPGQSVSPRGEEFLFVLAKDIGDFQPMFGHSCWSSSLEWKMGFSRSESNGLGAACIRVVETRKYRAVV